MEEPFPAGCCPPSGCGSPREALSPQRFGAAHPSRLNGLISSMMYLQAWMDMIWETKKSQKQQNQLESSVTLHPLMFI